MATFVTNRVVDLSIPLTDDKIVSSQNWNTAYSTATAYTAASGSYVTETVFKSISSILLLTSIYQNASGSFATNTALNAASSVLLPTSIYQNVSGSFLQSTIYQNASSNWQDTYTNVQTNSANWVLDGGNTKGSNVSLGTNDNFNLTLETNNTPRVTVLGSGNVGIRTTSPGQALTVSGNISASGEFTGNSISNLTLPGRLRANALTITDWNNATENGWYQGNNAANAPTSSAGLPSGSIWRDTAAGNVLKIVP